MGYQGLADELDGKYTLYGIQRPENITGKTIEFVGMKNLAQHYLREMRAIQPRGRYRIMGWSMGGLIAAQIIRLLERDGETVEFFATIDTVWPSPEDRRNLLGWAGGRISDDALDSILLDESKREGIDEAFGLSREGIPETAKARLRAFSVANALAAAEQDEYEEIHPGTYLRAQAARTIAGSDQAEQSALSGRHVRAAASQVVIEADHYSIMEPPAIRALSVQIVSRLQALDAADPGADATSTSFGDAVAQPTSRKQ